LVAGATEADKRKLQQRAPGPRKRWVVASLDEKLREKPTLIVGAVQHRARIVVHFEKYDGGANHAGGENLAFGAP
jgi:hypothetical protein